MLDVRQSNIPRYILGKRSVYEDRSAPSRYTVFLAACFLPTKVKRPPSSVSPAPHLQAASLVSVRFRVYSRVVEIR
jgi:hypothetical protein